MEKEFGLLWEVSASEFVFVTMILAGGAAYMTGRAAARGWMPNWQLVIYMVLLAAATRFIHFALFSGSLLSLYYYVVDLVVILVIAFIGMRVTRSGQMATQYRFAYDRSGVLGWKKR
ncbi:DUF6867 family protein [Aquibium microcysteis]|uniref:DUF6867 family protein n=1 Tax=Aquibium microcysteis TaxID=675281 RepID=UPI00165D2586|nr:hypothetical protein [Aquibium microcysteis]